MINDNKKATYTIIKDGEIDREMKCLPAYIEMQMQEGETYLEGSYPGNQYRLVEGVPVPIQEEAKPFVPSLFKPSQEVLVDLVQQMSDSGLHIPIHTEGTATKKLMKQAIDQAAGRTRSRFVSPGNMIGQEYSQALNQAQVCINTAGETVPPMMQTWAAALNETPMNAAMNILETAAQWEFILNVTYDLRLRGKAAVDAASAEEFEAIGLGYINQLDQIK